MTTVLHDTLLVGTVICVIANAFEVVAKAVRAPFVLKNSAAVGVGRRWLPYLAVLEGLGVAGLILGFLEMPLLGLAAACGLVLFFIGAVITHIRARVLHNIAFPSVYLVLAVMSVGYFASSGG